MMDAIERIERQHDGGEFVFIATITDGGDARLVVNVSAGELQTYSQFQKAILARYGVFFRNDDFEASRGRGAAAWRDEIEWQLSRKAAEVATR